jgi:hypothetical protein
MNPDVPTPHGVCGQMLVHSQTRQKCKAIQKKHVPCVQYPNGVFPKRQQS